MTLASYAPIRTIPQRLLGRDIHFWTHALGLDRTQWVGDRSLPAYLSDRDRATLMRFTGGEAGVLSGLVRNANEIRMRPAVVDVPVGNGRALIFATNPIYRWQNHGEFNMVFNAILNWNDLRPDTQSGTRTITEHR